MVTLTQFMLSEPMIIAGTAMDEIDLDYYLARRTTVTSRDDRGPSIFVTQHDDAVTEQYCKEHDLLLFVGWTGDFLAYCRSVLPNPPTPEELIPQEANKLIPPGASKAARIAFNATFELVPSVATAVDGSNFLYGHPPSWSDLERELDVSRSRVGGIIVDIENRVKNPKDPIRVVLISEVAGAGKTTALRRIAYTLSQRGVKVLMYSMLGHLDKSTASLLDLIDGPVVIIVDDFGDQVEALPDLLAQMEKKDIVIAGATRVTARSTFAG
jgi:hypothetical protein